MTRRIPEVPANAFSASVHLRWGDMDALGHVNNVQILRLLEEARVQLFRAMRSRERSYGRGILVARHEIDYLKPLQYSGGAPVRIPMWVERIGTSSFTIACVVVAPDGEVVSSAKSVIVSIDTSSGTSVPLPASLREQVSAYAAGS